MRLRKLVLVGLVAGASLETGPLQSADPPPRDELTFATSGPALINYEVEVVIGSETAREQYQGTLRYQIASPASSMGWEADGNLQVDRWRVQPSGFPGAHRGAYLNTVDAASSRFAVSKLGKITASSSEWQLALLLGDFTKWAIAPLPNDNQTEWERLEPIMVKQDAPDPIFGGLPRSPLRNPLLGVRGNDRLSPAMEKTSYKITGTEGPITVIEHTYELKANHTNPPMAVTGQGTGRFDRRRGVFDHLQWTRNVVIQQAGAEIRVPVAVTLRRTFDTGLVPLTPEEKAEQERQAAEAKAYAESPEGLAEAAAARQRVAEALAEAKRAEAERKQKEEAEAAAPFDVQERKAWIAALDAGKEYRDGLPIMRKLNDRAPRPDPELARALYEFANRLDSFEAARFWDLAGKFDENFAAVLALRKAYGASYTSLPEVGPPVPRTANLQEGQLVAAKREYGNDYQAMLVVNQDDKGTVFLTEIGSSSIKRVPLNELRLPAARVVPYLSEQQRPRATGGRAVEGLGPQAGAASAKPTRLELRTWTDRTGRYSMTGRFVSLTSDVVRLEKTDGTTVDVPLTKLRDADAEVARELANAAADPFKIVAP